MTPIRLSANNFRRHFRGGSGIAEFRGIPFSDPFTPEDWVGSTVSLFGCDGPGLSSLEDGRLLRDAVKAEPEAFLGPAHVACYGPDPALLVKLLDPDQRLPVHCHPDRAFSKRHLNLRYGKSEAWIVVATRVPDPTVYLGFREQTDRERLARWVDEQDTHAMLSAVNALPVKAGDTVFVPAGIPHAVGPGILMVELQEPTDLSILMEWKDMGIDGRKDGHLGLGYKRALDAVDRSAWSMGRLRGLVNAGSSGSLFSREAERFFRAQKIEGSAVMAPAYSILVVLQGSGSIRTHRSPGLEIRRGDTVLIPYAAGETRLEGTLEAIRCLPPVTIQE